MFHILLGLQNLDDETVKDLGNVLEYRPDILILPPTHHIIPDVKITNKGGDGDIRLGDNLKLPMRLADLCTAIEECGLPPQTIVWDKLVLEPYTGKLNCDGENITLTDLESGILTRLMRAKGQAVSRTTLLAGVWGFAPEIETHTLDTHIYRLRQKIEPNPMTPRYVLTASDSYYIQ